MFKKIGIENSLKDNERVARILSNFPNIPVVWIDDYRDFFGSIKKPYLQKRDNLNLILAEKRGQIVKQAPPAYGISNVPHYYFVHSYNCIYECNYCYLQGYMSSPDIVLFMNHKDIFNEIESVAKNFENISEVWFHAGEFSDSLALSNLSGEIPDLYELFQKIPYARLELRTKSVQISSLLSQKPQENIFITYSLAPDDKVRQNEYKTPRLKARLQAMRKLYEEGHRLGIHFDPIIWSDDCFDQYSKLITELETFLPLSKVEYFSLGVVRFTSDVYNEVKKNYPDAEFINQNLYPSFDGKVRYQRPLRNKILKGISDLILSRGVDPKKIYLCMEEN